MGYSKGNASLPHTSISIFTKAQSRVAGREMLDNCTGQWPMVEYGCRSDLP
jgi:hypothetical protein